MYNNINHRYVNHRNRIQNSYNPLVIFLAADGGWPPAANFTLVINYDFSERGMLIFRFLGSPFKSSFFSILLLTSVISDALPKSAFILIVLMPLFKFYGNNLKQSEFCFEMILVMSVSIFHSHQLVH